VSGGERLQPSGTKTFNYDGPYELRTDYQASLCEHKGSLYMFTANRPPVAPEAVRPKSYSLVMQRYQGKHAWSEPASVAENAAGEPFAVSDTKTLYLFYPTEKGIQYRFGTPDALGSAVLIPGTVGMQVSAVNWYGKIYLFQYSGADANIQYRSIDSSSVGPLQDIGIRSNTPPGPAVDTIHRQLLVGTTELQGQQKFRWQLRRFNRDNNGDFKIASTHFLGGDTSGWAGNKRPTIIFNPSTSFGPEGKIYWIAAGVSNATSGQSGFYVGQTIAYKDKNDGWLLWRYYDEWTNTRTGIGAAWFDNDITIATTWASGTAGGDGGVFVGYNGTAIGNVDMGDFAEMPAEPK